MIKFVRMARQGMNFMLGLSLVGLLSACGGGGSAGDSVFTPSPGTSSPGGSTAADLVIVLDKASIANSGTDAVTLTVTSVNANNSAVGNVPVTFAVDNGGVVTPAGTTTAAATGILTATVKIGSDRSNRTLNVTVSSGSISKKVSFNVVDSITGGSVADLALTLSRSTIPNDGSQAVTVTVTTLDALRNVVGGSPVTMKVTDVGDAFISTGGKTSTDPTSGQLLATVNLAANHTNRTIAVTATSGTVTRSVTFDVVDSQVTIPKASNISILLDKTSVGNNGSDTVIATVTAVTASGAVVSGIPVTFTVDNNANYSQSAAQTDAQGIVTATVRIGADKSNRLITVTAKSDSLVRTATFQVIGAKLQGTALPSLPAAGSTGNRVEYRLSDVNQNAMAAVPITVSAPGIASASGVTDANGAYVFTYTAPATPGPVDITAAAGGATSVLTITVPSATSTVPPATLIVTAPSVSASPSVVSVNTTDTANRSEIRALFLAANNAPVKNVRVRFDLNGDVNSIGGTLSSADSLVYSDASGLAITNYSPAGRSSPTNGVTIRACWDYNDFAATACPNQVLTNLTVVSDPLSITIGTNEVLEDGPSGLTYVKKYVLLVVDSAGNPKPDVQVTPSIDLTYYLKGFYDWSTVEAVWKPHFYLDTISVGSYMDGFPTACLSEDLNKNGSLDAGDDRNGNAQLDPRKSDASISMVGSTKTDANGTAVLKIEYPKSVAGWVLFRITASAAGVLSPPAYYPGPNSSTALPVSATALKTETPPPAFRTSPYGVVRKSSDGIATPSFCTNSN